MSKQERIEVATRQDCCPECGRPLGRRPEEGHRVGSGRVSDGVFCSLECMTQFHADYFSDRIEHGTPSPN